MKKLISTAAILMAGVSFLRADYVPAFQVGESLTFTIRWGVITGGYATLSVPSIDRVEGQSAYHILSEAKSTGMVETFYRVRDKNEAWMDTTLPRSYGYTRNIHEGKYRVNDVVKLDQDALTFHRTKIRHDKDGATAIQEGSIPPNALDVFSSLYYIRSLPLKVGKSFTIDVHSGKQTWPLVVKVHKLETVKVKAGKFLCYRVEPILRGEGIFVSKGKKLEVWLTADERRMPVMMRSEIFIGHVSAELVKAVTPEPRDPEPQLAKHPVPAPETF